MLTYVTAFVSFSLYMSLESQNVIAQADAGFTVKIFENPSFGISFQYPSYWQPASEEYSKHLTEQTKEYMDNLGVVDKSHVVVDMYPKSNSGAYLTILSDDLPFQKSSKQYLDANKALFDKMGAQIKNKNPYLIDNIWGYKYNITMADGFTQTQVLFTIGSKGFVINYYLGDTDQSKDSDAIKIILDSIMLNKQQLNPI